MEIFSNVEPQHILSCLKGILYWSGKKQISICEQFGFYTNLDGTSDQFIFLEAAVNTRNDDIISFVDEYIEQENVVCNKPSI